MKSIQIFSRLLEREILQIRFRPTLQWFALRANLAAPLEDRYEEWRSDGSGNVAMFSPTSKKALEVFTTNITFLNEGDINSLDGYKDIETILPFITKESSVTEIKRIGCRRTFVFHTKFDFAELTDLIYRKLYNKLPDGKVLQVGKVSDIAYVLDTEDESFKTHIQMGAVHSEEGLKQFDAKFELSKKPDDDKNLFLDIDVSASSGLANDNVLDRLSDVRERAISTVENYLTFLSS